MPPFPEDHKDQGSRGDHREGQDEVRLEPVIALAFVKDDLKSAQSERYKAKSDIVDAGFAELAPPEIRRVLNKPARPQDGKKADRNVAEKNHAPGEIDGDPHAESRPYGGRQS